MKGTSKLVVHISYSPNDDEDLWVTSIIGGLQALSPQIEVSTNVDNPSLSGTVYKRLKDSNYLIVIASTSLIEYSLADEEVSTFLSNHGIDRVIILEKSYTPEVFKVHELLDDPVPIQFHQKGEVINKSHPLFDTKLRFLNKKLLLLAAKKNRKYHGRSKSICRFRIVSNKLTDYTSILELDQELFRFIEFKRFSFNNESHIDDTENYLFLFEESQQPELSRFTHSIDNFLNLLVDKLSESTNSKKNCIMWTPKSDTAVASRNDVKGILDDFEFPSKPFQLEYLDYTFEKLKDTLKDQCYI